MPIFLTKHDLSFPVDLTPDEHGIVAVGGDLSPQRLLNAYHAGIFPWPHEGLPLLWFSPDPRFVLAPKEVVIKRSLRKALKKTSFTVKADHNFLLVMEKCAEPRKDQQRSWINQEMREGYHSLHDLGFAHSVEAYDGEELVGGLYGIALGGIFFGESMFFEKTDASKICFITLVAHLLEWDFFLIDCQAHTKHLENFGAHYVSRKIFLEEIKKNQKLSHRKGKWHFHFTPEEALFSIDSR